ncbi:MAG: helix-turn-helix transcriptional regulator, partial [Bacteroidetes bacterium]|nr:helix-turn-helix transcriptional regulator [Bacteroidota bacterium]
MLTHQALWDAIDRLAERNHMSVSGLAKCAGLNPTTFNRSKRVGRDGKLRWPSTESLSKILEVTDTLPESFLEDRVFAPSPFGGKIAEKTVDHNSLTVGNAVRENASPYYSPTPSSDVTIPAARFGQTRHTPLFNEAGLPCGGAWDEILFPEAGGSALYAMDIDDHSFAPTYRYGDRLVVSPTAEIRVGDRVIVGTGPC